MQESSLIDVKTSELGIPKYIMHEMQKRASVTSRENRRSLIDVKTSERRRTESVMH